jgi:hypothetical protein
LIFAFRTSTEKFSIPPSATPSEIPSVITRSKSARHGRQRALNVRKILRSIHEGVRDLAREIAKTEAYQTSRRQRKKVEMLFAHLKCILKLDLAPITWAPRPP